jgi:hypothetical protein
MGNSKSNFKYEKQTDNKNNEIIRIVLLYENGEQRELNYPESQKWIDEINSCIINAYIHGEVVSDFKWKHRKYNKIQSYFLTYF